MSVALKSKESHDSFNIGSGRRGTNDSVENLAQLELEEINFMNKKSVHVKKNGKRKTQTTSANGRPCKFIKVTREKQPSLNAPSKITPLEEAELAIKYVLDKGPADEDTFNYGY